MATPSDRRLRERVLHRSTLLHREYMLTIDKPDYEESRLLDLSDQGCSFATSQRYATGALLEVRLLLFGWDKYKSGYYTGDPRKATDPLVALVRVTNIRPIDAAGGRRVGCEFESIDESHRKALAQFIADIATET